MRVNLGDPQLAVMSRTWVVRPLYAAPQPGAAVVCVGVCATTGGLLVRVGDGLWQRFEPGAMVEVEGGEAREWRDTPIGGKP